MIGNMIELPCKIGDIVYALLSYIQKDGNAYKQNYHIAELHCNGFDIRCKYGKQIVEIKTQEQPIGIQSRWIYPKRNQAEERLMRLKKAL